MSNVSVGGRVPENRAHILFSHIDGPKLSYRHRVYWPTWTERAMFACGFFDIDDLIVRAMDTRSMK